MLALAERGLRSDIQLRLHTLDAPRVAMHFDSVASQFGSTALMWAAEMGHSELVDTLLDSGAELEARNRVSSFFHRALPGARVGAEREWRSQRRRRRRGEQRSTMECLESFVHDFAERMLTAPVRGVRGAPPGDRQAAGPRGRPGGQERRLLRTPPRAGEQGEPCAPGCAPGTSHSRCMSWLARRRSRQATFPVVGVRAQFGCTALIWAVEQGHADVAVLLMERGANPDVTDKVSPRGGSAHAAQALVRATRCPPAGADMKGVARRLPILPWGALGAGAAC